MAKTEALSITLPTEIVEKIRKDAEVNFRSVSSEIAYIASRYFAEKESQE